MKKAIIIIIAVLVVAGGAFAGLYFFTDTFNFMKPASDNFSMQAKKLMGNEKDPKYSEYEEFLNKLKSSSSSYSSDLNMSMNLSLPSDTIDYSTQRLINSSSIKYKGSYDANSKASQNDIGLYKDSKEVLTLSTIAKDQTISVSCKDLYDKYLTFDSTKLESFCQANNIELDEETKQAFESLSKMKDVNIDSSKLAYDLFYLSEDDFNSLQKTYGNILVDLIDKENYTTKKNQKITVDGEEEKATAYSLTMSGEDAYDFINKLLDLAKNDSTLKKLIVDKYNVIKKYSESYAELATDVETNGTSSNTSTTTQANTDLPELKESDIDSFLSELIKELEKTKDSFDDDTCIKLTIYSNKKNEPVKFEIAVLDDKDDDEGTVIFTEDLAEGKNIYTIDLKNIAKLSEDSSSRNSSSSSSSKSSKSDASSILNSVNSGSSSRVSSSVNSIANSLSEIVIEDSYKSTDDSREGTITISAKASGSKQDMIEIKYDIVNSKSESKFNLSVSSPLSSSISFDLVSEVTGLDTDTQKLNFSLSGKYSSYSVKFNADGTIKSGAEIQELNSSNSVDVFTLSANDFQQVYADIITKAADVLPSKLSTYGVKVTKEDILSALPQASSEPLEGSETPDNGTVTDPNSETPAEQPAA